MSKGSLIWVFTLFLVLVIFTAKGAIFLDPDFGWHLKMGEYITLNGIPKSDPFSYTMPSFHFIDHEWAANFLIFHAYNTFGYNFLALVFSTFAITSPLIILPKQKPVYILPILIIAYGILLSYTGIRPQVLSWFFIALFLKVILNKGLYQKYGFFLPLLILVWTNLHGSFVISLVLLLIYLVLKSLNKKRIQKSDIVIFLCSIFATFINPYGLRIYAEIWSQLSDTSLKWRVSEWQPIFVLFDISLIAFSALLLVFVLTYFRKLEKVNLVGLGLFTLMGLSSLRHIPLFIIASIFTISICLSYFYREIAENKLSLWRFNRVLIVLSFVSLALFLFQLFQVFHSKGILNETNYYPKKAVDFLKSHPQVGNLFNEYGWGGYLIWKYPEKKVFIDGRMPSWRRQDAMANESNYAMDEYDKVYYEDGDVNALSSKYNVNIFLVRNDHKKGENSQSLFKELDKKFTRLLLGKNLNQVDLETRLKNAGWNEIYRDEIALIYKRYEAPTD
jgi:hypothetical protein